jgi:hypothetical protein
LKQLNEALCEFLRSRLEFAAIVTKEARSNVLAIEFSQLLVGYLLLNGFCDEFESLRVGRFKSFGTEFPESANFGLVFGI